LGINKRTGDQADCLKKVKIIGDEQ
jgi:hypothetical protein